jgi:hypothetical protein
MHGHVRRKQKMWCVRERERGAVNGVQREKAQHEQDNVPFLERLMTQ